MTIGSIPSEFRFSGYRLDVERRKLFDAEDTEINLSSRAFDTLLVLVTQSGETLTKADLMAAVWPAVIVEENNLNQAIFSLRKALGDTNSERQFIQTVPGRGYRFVAELETTIANIEADTSMVSEHPASELDETIRQQSHKPHKVSQNQAAAKPANHTLVFSVFLGAILAISTFLYLRYEEGEGDGNLAAASGSALSGGRQSGEILPNSIAVLPFTNLDPDSGSDLFSLGLHDEVISQLSKIRSLSVISRDSVVALSNQQLSISDLGRRLQVESVMTGTVLFVGESARVNLQMLEPRTGVTLWAATYDADTRNLSDMLSIQNDIAVNVTMALETEINQQEQQALEATPTESFEAYRYHLAARNSYYSQEFEETWTLTQQALELDPNYVDALYLFSYVNTVLTAIPLQGLNSSDHFQLALESAERIIEIAPERSEGYSLKASALSTNKEWGRVAIEVKRLKEMGVPLADMKFYALILLCLGDFQGAIDIFEANLFIEPVNLYGRGFLLSAYELAGNREQSRQEYLIGEELNSVWWGDTIDIFLSLGRNEPLRSIDDLPAIPSELEYLLKNLNDQGLVASSLQAYVQRENKMSAETVYYSAIAAHSGEPELAIELMRDALNDVWLNFHWLWLPLFDEARQLDSFKGLLKDSGIVDYWESFGWPEVCQPEGESFSCEWTAYP